MVSYKELGLVNTREMFAKAIKGGYAIPAFNFNNMEQLQAIISACVEANSPVILQVSAGARKYANQTLLRYMAQGAVEYAKELNGGKGIPITLHLDHGNSFELCKSCIDMGFSSVMIDGSHLFKSYFFSRRLLCWHVLPHIRVDPFADQFIRGRTVGFRRSLKGFRDLPF